MTEWAESLKRDREFETDETISFLISSRQIDDQVQDALFTALEAGKRFLDTPLSFLAQEYHLISFSEWMRLPAVIMTVAELCIPTEDHAAIGWDAQAAQERVRLDLCLESLCYRMQTLSTFDKTKQPHPDFWHALRMVNDLTKNWYIRKIRPERPRQTPSMYTSSGSIEHSASESSCSITSAPRMRSTHHVGDRYKPLAGANYMEDFNIDMPHEDEVISDPFALMRNVDFDTGLFFDAAWGICGDESYDNFAGMAYGGGAPF